MLKLMGLGNKQNLYTSTRTKKVTSKTQTLDVKSALNIVSGIFANWGAFASPLSDLLSLCAPPSASPLAELAHFFERPDRKGVREQF